MKSVLAFVEDSARAFAVLFLIVATAPTMAASPADDGEPPGGRTAIRVALGVLAVALLADACRASRVPLRGARASLRAVGRLVVGRGFVGRWYRLSFHEPFVPRGQARLSLANLCGYRLVADGYRITSLRPTMRRWRFGVWVTVERPARAGRRCCRLRGGSRPVPAMAAPVGTTDRRSDPAPPVRRWSLSLESMSGEEIDGLLRGRDAGAEGNGRAPARRSATPRPDPPSVR
ncbi:MAG: hypothetical protein WKF75_08415 [Singulisphaera sp.]